MHAGGPGAVIDNLKGIPGFLDFFGIATPTLIDGVQQADGALAAFGPAGKYGFDHNRVEHGLGPRLLRYAASAVALYGNPFS